MNTSLISASLAALALASAPCAQTIVSGGGPALQNAIVAAAIGDTILVQAGTYDPMLVDKVSCLPTLRCRAAHPVCR